MAMTYEQRPHPRLDIDALTKLVGASITSTPPPEGFDPLEASQEDLKKFGFPVRPDPKFQPTEYAFWQKMFAKSLAFEKFEFEILPPVATQGRGFFWESPRRETSLNWSGAYITPRDSTIFSSIWAM